MCKAMEDMRRDAKLQQATDSVKRWYEMGMSVDQIAQGEGLTVKEVETIVGQDKATVTA